MNAWTDELDLVVVGSGGGGMTAALAAVDAGLSVVVIEKGAKFGGSTGISSRAQPVRAAAVAARAKLLQLASANLGVPVAQLTVEKGVVSGGGKTVKYGDLLGGKVFSVTMNPTTLQVGAAPAKAIKDYKLVGKTVPRVDLPGKITGRYTYRWHQADSDMW